VVVEQARLIDGMEGQDTSDCKVRVKDHLGFEEAM